MDGGHHVPGERSGVLIFEQTLFLRVLERGVKRGFQPGQCGGYRLEGVFIPWGQLARGIGQQTAAQGDLAVSDRFKERFNSAQRIFARLERLDCFFKGMLGVTAQRGLKELFFTAEGLVHTAAADAHMVDQVLHGGRFITLFPKQLDRALQDLLGLEFLLSGHL